MQAAQVGRLEPPDGPVQSLAHLPALLGRQCPERMQLIGGRLFIGQHVPRLEMDSDGRKILAGGDHRIHFTLTWECWHFAGEG